MKDNQILLEVLDCYLSGSKQKIVMSVLVQIEENNIAKIAPSSIWKFVKGHRGSLYRALKGLEKKGLITKLKGKTPRETSFKLNLNLEEIKKISLRREKVWKMLQE